MKRKILIVYTGGTIGMMQDAKGILKPMNFKKITQFVPELNKIDVILESISFEKPIDSSNIDISHWLDLLQILKKNYNLFDGFVILHGSDTMSYTASMLSFMISNLNKPIIITGSQLPVGIIRTDGKENLITAIEIAASYKNNKPLVPEVCIYFEYKLLRGNRSLKYNASHFDAFKSPNYPILAEAGINIDYFFNYILKSKNKETKFYNKISNEVGVLHLFPGISQIQIDLVLQSNAKVIVMLSYGSGNASTDKKFIASLAKAINNNKYIVNVTQCIQGSVEQGKYETSSAFTKIGIIPGYDLTVEAVITKSMFLLGNYKLSEFKKQFNKNLSGEISL